MRTIQVWLYEGGPFVVPLLVIGLAALLVIIERIVYIVIKSKIHARPFIESVISLVRAGKIDEALQLCADHQAALPDLGLVILRSHDAEEQDLSGVAKTASITMMPELTRRLAWLPALTILSILVGAVGFLANLHEALTQGLAPAAAVAFAIRPLGLSMIIAIPIVAAHSYLVGESQKLATQLEEFSVRLVGAILDRPDVRLGHRG